MVMSDGDLLRITAYEMLLLSDAAKGMTYPSISKKRNRSRKAVERASERLRDKLRPWGGGSKAGLVHWYDTHYARWRDLVIDPPSEA